MSFTTHFQHTETTYLPLPPLRSDQSYNTIAERGLKVALSLIQDHDFMISLNPLSTGHEEIPASVDQAVDVEKMAAEFNVPLTDYGSRQRVNGGDDWKHYEIHDQVPVAFSYKKAITFYSALRNVSDGMESLTDPGNSVTIHGKYSVFPTREDPSTLTLMERTTTHCSLMLGWYIRSSLGSSHAEIHQLIKARFVEEMKK